MECPHDFFEKCGGTLKEFVRVEHRNLLCDWVFVLLFSCGHKTMEAGGEYEDDTTKAVPDGSDTLVVA